MRSIRCPAAVLLAAALVVAAALPASGEDGLVRLSVVFTNDIHGGIDRSGATFMNREFPPPLGGAASAATYIGALRERAEREGGYVLVIDQGDIFQGTPVGNLNSGEAVIEYFNKIGVDVWTVGNHDFDEGFENLWHLIEYSRMPVLSANLVWAESQEPVEYVEPYIIKDYGGIKVAVIGLTTTDTPAMAFPAHVEPVAFLDEFETARKYVREVREKGADIVFVSGHMGLPYDPEAGYAEMIDEEEEREAENVREPLEERKWGPSAMEISHYVPGIDAFFGGHIHKGF
ncbi:MAG: metallophosphoesterase, partial [Candidatus Eisenbacteria bacterium]